MNNRSAGLVAKAGAAVCAFGLAVLSVPAFANGLIAHRAIYDVTLDEAKEATGISAMNGRMVYEFSGSACEGYSVSFRFVTEFRDTDGGSQTTDLRSTTFEDNKTGVFQFATQTFIDRKSVERSRGSVTNTGDTKTIELQEPEKRSLSISNETLFPTAHLNRIIAAAKAGDTFLSVNVFDGSETGDKVYPTTAIIGSGRREAVPVSDEPSAPASSIGEVEAWPVTLAYFDPDEAKTGGEQTPVYQLSFLLYENGISRQLKMNYGDFTVSGQLIKLELLDQASCVD